MTEFIDFLKTYWFQLLTGVCFVIEIIFIFVKRRPKSIDEFKALLQEILNLVPAYVEAVECPGRGSEKKAYVIEHLVSKFSAALGRSLTEKEIHLVEEAIGDQIELVLSAPTKKEGGSYEK